MVEVLDFRSKIVEMTGGREAVLAEAEQMLGSTHPITRAGDASRIPRKDVQKHVVETILAASKNLVRASLAELIVKHSMAIENEFILFEGEIPDSPGDRDDWVEALYDFQRPLFEGDTVTMVGPKFLEDWLRQDKPVEDLVDAILAKPVKDVANALAQMGVTTTDIERLVAKIVDNQMSPQAAAKPDSPASEEPQTAEPQTAEPKTATPRRRAPSVAEANDVTRAAQKALEVLAEVTSIKEGEVASVLGVSRPQANNYKAGKTLLAPTEAQAEALTALFDGVIAKLKAARDEFDLAMMGS